VWHRSAPEPIQDPKLCANLQSQVISKRVFRVVLASPSDVSAERSAAVSAVEQVNVILRTFNLDAALEIVRWERDAYPGMHSAGPQGLIDEQLCIESSDILIGVFWRRFGTPCRDALSGTEHEVRLAIASWRIRQAPQVMVYFCNAPFQPTSQTEAEQFEKVATFRKGLKAMGDIAIFDYRDVAAFQSQLIQNLLQVVRPIVQSHTRGEGPMSFLSVSAAAKPLCARFEGTTELVGDVFLRCTYRHDSPARAPIYLTIVLSITGPITSPVTGTSLTDAVLFEVGRAGEGAIVRGVRDPECAVFSTLTFHNVRLADIQPNETRVLQVSNVRCDCTAVPKAEHFPVWAYVGMIGASIEGAEQVVATVRNGLAFEVRDARNANQLPEAGLTLSATSPFDLRRIATLRFVEGFPGAFKTRVPTLGHIWDTYEGDMVLTAESAPISVVFQDQDGVAQVPALVDHGTCLQANFFNLPGGMQIFVSTRDLGVSGHANLTQLESLTFPNAPVIIDNVEARELSLKSGNACAIWELGSPLFPPRIGAFLEFAIFAAYTPDGSDGLRFGPTSMVQGVISPTSVTYSASGPMPMFGPQFEKFRKLFALEP